MEFIDIDNQSQLILALNEVKSFCMKYPELARNSQFNLEWLLENIKTGYLSGVYSGLAGQLLSASGVEQTLGIDYWSFYYDKMFEFFDFSNYKTILEVGCGYFPILASRLSKLQNHLRVDAIDPNVVSSWSLENGVNPIPDVFKYDTGLFYDATAVSKYDFLFGIHPCVATLPLINSSCDNGKEMFLALCDCNGFDGFFSATYDDWVRYVLDVVDRKLPRDMYCGKITFDSRGDVSRPLIHTHKRRYF